MAYLPSEDPITIAELEEIARKRLPSAWYSYFASGADEQRALRSNVEALNQLHILPRVLRDVSAIDTGISMLGQPWPLPIAVSPTGMQKMAGGEGELDVARAVGKFGINMVLSSSATASMEDVISAGQSAAPDSRFGSRFWFQLYLTDDMARNEKLINRAEAAGYEALVLTVDTAVSGNRYNERKNPVVLPPGLWLPNTQGPTPPKERKPNINRIIMDARTAKQASEILQAAGRIVNSASLTWSDMEQLRKMTRMKIILKGIMTPEDAELAVQHGIDAIIVSNHGGRQLDCTVATTEALPAIVGAVRRRIPVMVDGGFRRGSDIVKAVALGADAVLIGRPVLWGLAFNGQAGVETVLHIFERELSRAMALAGVSKLADLEKSYLGVRAGWGVSRL
ncbi:S-2-hydroxy-acid oxidase, partial [Thozetella sp. PMI_491]